MAKNREKKSPQIFDVIAGIKFSPREIDTLSCILHGKSAKKIGTLLSISTKTVDAHTRNLMLKLDLNSRESIADFAEAAPEVNQLRRHYSHLICQNLFNEKLKEISFITHKMGLSFSLLEFQTCDFVTQLIKDLKLTGINVFNNDSTLRSHHLRIQQTAPYSHIVHVDDLSSDNIIHFEDDNYFSAFFELVKCFVKDSKIDKIIDDFNKNIPHLRDDLQTPYPIKIPKQIIGGISAALIFIFGFLYFIYLEQETKVPPIRSDLIIPSDQFILDRHPLKNELSEKLKGEGIQTVALVGIGGSGKTTLSRKYARSVKSPIIWEINAETHQSLIESFDKLAQALSIADEDKRLLNEIKSSRNQEENEGRTIEFIRNKLKETKNWLLIFDNVEKFSDIQKYFPHDPELWGTGKVLITTRDSTIQGNNLLSHVIKIGELNHDEKFALFSKIMNKERLTSFSQAQAIEVKNFLKEIPPYPLDVSIAAQYIKGTNETLNNYLESLNKSEKEFDSTQEKILSEGGNYTKTRYGIITLSLKRILASKNDYTELLLLLSLIDSQKISREIFDAFKSNDTVSQFILSLKKESLITDGTSYDQKENNLISIHRSTQQITRDYLKKTLNLEKEKSKFDTLVSFLNNYMTQLIAENNVPKMKNIANHVGEFLKQGELLEETQEADLLGKLGWINVYLGKNQQGKELLEYSRSLMEKAPYKDHLKIAWTKRSLGCVNSKLGNYNEAKTLLEESIAYYKKTSDTNNSELAEAQNYLAWVYMHLCEFKTAKDFYEENLIIYKKTKGEQDMEYAITLAALGVVYKRMGLYNDAILSLEKALNIFNSQSINTDIYKTWVLNYLGSSYGNIGQYEKGLKIALQAFEENKKHYNEKSRDIGLSLTNLGNLYRRLGLYEDALVHLKNGYKIYENYFGNDHIETAWSAIHLGNGYRVSGDYDQAEFYLKKGFKIYSSKFGKNHNTTGWALIYLGNLYNDKQEYEKAKESLEEGLRIYTEYFGENHLDTAWIWGSLGDIYLTLGDDEKAEAYMKKGLEINEKNKNPELCFNLSGLASLYRKWARDASNNGHIEKAAEYKNKADDLQMRALKLANETFPKGSKQLQRLKTKNH
jgi:tetratricopeptide (TPR) repeat protein/DNA-binding CsgD family transcriptional regulator